MYISTWPGMRSFQHVVWFALILLFCGCALFEAKETRYLTRAQDRATQEDVEQRLGDPNIAQTSPSGESIWVYWIYDWQPGSRTTSAGNWCDEYTLTFDAQKTLRHWTHAIHFHAGEAFPTYCVRDGDRALAS
jgi:hypothetical protein